jgi:hypothetical protein
MTNKPVRLKQESGEQYSLIAHQVHHITTERFLGEAMHSGSEFTNEILKGYSGVSGPCRTFVYPLSDLEEWPSAGKLVNYPLLTSINRQRTL